MDNWTNEEFQLMTEKLAKRKQREADAIRGRSGQGETLVSDKEFAARTGGVIKVKHGD